MSEENVENMRRWLEAISGEDFDTAISLVHPDIEFVPPGGQPPYRGAESVRRWMEPDALREQVVQPLESVVVADTTVLARQHVAARGASSGIELDVISWSVWTFDDDGLITRIEIYLDHEEDKAREAAGLGDQAMSQENVEIARRSFGALNRTLAEGVDDFYEFLDAEVEWIPITTHLDGRTYHGTEGVRRWADDMRRDWAVYEIRWKEGRDLGGGRVLGFGIWDCLGRRGGVRLSFDQAAWLIEIRGEKMSRLQTFVDREKALEAAGLRE